jgi:uridine kinase
VFNFREGRRVATKPVTLERDQVLVLDCLHGFYPSLGEGISATAQFRLFIEAQNMLYEGDGRSQQLTHFTDVRLLRRMLRDSHHRNHNALGTLLHWHYVREGELFSIIPLMGLADHVINGGFPFDLPALKPFFSGENGILPKPEALADYAGFLDARIRYERVKALLESVEGLSPAQVADTSFIPGDAVIREFIGGGTIQIPHNE